MLLKFIFIFIFFLNTYGFSLGVTVYTETNTICLNYNSNSDTDFEKIGLIRNNYKYCINSDSLVINIIRFNPIDTPIVAIGNDTGLTFMSKLYLKKYYWNGSNWIK